jgi:hypothetical protein
VKGETWARMVPSRGAGPPRFVGMAAAETKFPALFCTPDKNATGRATGAVGGQTNAWRTKLRSGCAGRPTGRFCAFGGDLRAEDDAVNEDTEVMP